MGRYVAKINKTYVEYGDYSWDYVKQNKPKEYYDKERIILDAYLDGKKVEQIEVPVEELVDIKLVKTLYSWEWNDNKSLHKWLFSYLTNKGEKITGYVEATLGTFDLNYEKPLVDGYYLQSEIGDEDIKLSREKKIHKIDDYEKYRWCRLRLLRVQSN